MFKFSLQKALEVRERVEKVRMKEMAEKLSIQKAIEAQIEAIHSKIAGQDEQTNQAKHAGRIDINQLKMLEAFRHKKRHDLGKLDSNLQKATKETEAKRVALVEASRQRKTLEILREQELKRYQKEMAKQELMMMDEAAGNHYFQHHHQVN